MAFNVTFLSFTKRENSTKTPTSTQISNGLNKTCVLIDDTSFMNPTFKIEHAYNMASYNYCYVQEFRRYYFITDIRSYQNFWYISCTCDVLATYKTTIGSSSHYVLRAASSYDEYITDNMYGGKNVESATFLPQTGALYWSTGHSYIVGITGYAPNTTQQVGSVTYYQMDDTGLYNFIYYLMHNINDWCDIPTAQYDIGVQEALLNPIQYIVSCIALPVSFPTTYTSVSRINFGYYYWDIEGSGKYRALTLGETRTETNTISIPKHPQAATRGKYMNGSPFTTYTFHMGPWGDIPLDPIAYIDADYLRYKVTYDLCQGVGRLVVGPAIDGNDNIINISYCGQIDIGASVQLSQAIIDPLQAELSWETGLNSTIAAGLAGGISMKTPSNLLTAQNQLQQTYADALRNRYPTCTGKGVPGSFFSFFDSSYGCYLNAKFITCVDENLTELGRPLCQTKQINTLSGYILCSGADCQITGTQDEAIKVNNYMNSGFFYE